MFWIILLFALALGFVVGVALLKKDIYSGTGELLAIVCGACFLVGLLLVPIAYVSSRSSVNQFKQQSAYLQAHIPVNAVEDAALTNKKVELNTWLYDAQYQYEYYRFFSVYPAEIADLKPIE